MSISVGNSFDRKEEFEYNRIMSSRVCGIIIGTSYDGMGATRPIELFGKTMEQWVSLAVQGPVVCVEEDSSLTVPQLIRSHLDPQFEYTVVLYSDTPLITAKTVSQAIADAKDTNATVIRMTRGFVFRTDFVAGVDKIYTEQTHFYNEEDFVTVFSFQQLALVREFMRNRILAYHMDRGVYVEDMASTFIGSGVSIGKGVRIGPNNVLSGNTVLKDGVRLYEGNGITDAVLDEGCVVTKSQIVHSYVGKGTVVGPFANVREDNVIGANCKIGDFVELKKCKIGDGNKISHLSYLGNVWMGNDCNVGAGVVFANYDGKNKHTCVVGDRVFVGSKATVVAPCTLADGSFVAAGSTIVADVSAGALAIARARQVEKRDWKGNLYAKPDSE